MKKISLLIVDDEELIQKALVHIFKPDKRYRVRGYTTVAEVREEVAQNSPQVVICDYLMPEMDGLTLIRELKGRFPRLRGVLLTARTFDQTIMDALQSGEIDRYFSKPWNQKELEETVKRLAREVAKDLDGTLG
jgi:DNA-binding NtrC family response regulator